MEKAAIVSSENTNPLNKSAWKVDVLVNTILHTLEMALK